MSAPSSASPLKEVCPKCGDFAIVDEVTGWCYDCSGLVSNPSTGQTLSTNYGNKTEIAFAANADAIEYHLANGADTVWQALTLSRQDRAVCLVCGEVMPHAPRTAVFCRRYKECRRYSRRYVYLYTEKGMSKAQALAMIFNELT